MVLCLMILDVYFQMLIAIIKKIILTEYAFFIGEEKLIVYDDEFKNLLYDACEKYNEIHPNYNFFRTKLN